MKKFYQTKSKNLLFLGFIVLLLFGVKNVSAQSSVGTEFWIAFPQNYTGGGQRQLYITAEQDAIVHVDVVNPAFTQTINVAAGTLETVDLPTTVDITSNGVVEDKGIHVTSDTPVSVFGMNQIQYSTDAFMAIPVDAVGTDYYVMSYVNLLLVQMTIVATEDNTTVTITPTVSGGGFTAGTPGNVVLNEGEVFQLSSSTSGADYTGSHVVSDKPVSVFGGNNCANVPPGTYYCDYLISQMVPSTAWGQSFVTVPLATRTAGDIFRILAQEDGTEVSINGSVVSTLDAGEFYETSLGSNTYNRITSNKPIMVGQFSKGSTADGTVADPFYALVPPDEQFLNNYVVSAGTPNIPNNFLNITSPTSNTGTVKVDNVTVSSELWTPIPGTIFSGAQVPITNGIHSVTSSLPVGLLVYGFGVDDSYGYTGGQSFGAVALVSSVEITPKTSVYSLNDNECWEALVKDQFGDSIPGVRVDFNIDGPNSASSGFAFTNEDGIATFCFEGMNEGTDTIEADIGNLSDKAVVTWTSDGIDRVAPNVQCHPITVYLWENGEYVLDKKDIANISAGSTDNITPVKDLKISVFPNSFECIHVYQPVSVKVTATDAQGNSSYCRTTVTVLDTISPTAVCKDVTVYLDENGKGSIISGMVNQGGDRESVPEWARTYNGLEGGSWDACGIDILAVSQQQFTPADIGEKMVTLTAVDPSGNLATCTASVFVQDTIPPVIQEIDDIEMMVEPGVCETAVDYPEIQVTDYSEVTLNLEEGLGPEGMFPLGTTTEKWMATDASGNTAEVTFNVTITTTNALPTIDPIDDVEVDEDAPAITVPLTGLSYGIDCEAQEFTVDVSGNNPDLIGSIELNHTEGSETGSVDLTLVPDMSGTAEIMVTVEDSQGATNVATFDVVVNPVNDPPFVASPIPDQSVNASFELKVPLTSATGNVFDDIDSENLTFEATVEGTDTLPSWAAWSGDTLMFMPMIADTGCVNFVVTATDDMGAAVSDTFEVCVDGYPVGIEQIAARKFSVNMYPNPTHGKVNLEFENYQSNNVGLAVYNANGKLIMQKQFSVTDRMVFDMSGEVSGIYFVRLNLNSAYIVKKLIVK